MEEKIEDILDNNMMWDGQLNKTKAITELLNLFSVSQRSELFLAVLKWAKQADLYYPDEMLLKDFEQFTAKNCG